MHDATSPTARALLTLELLQAEPGIGAERLGHKLGVSERAARRYVGILREAGIPVESERGPYGGYRLGRGIRLPPLMFSADEALGLVMAVLDGHHDVSDPTDPVGAALGKIMRALPAPVAEHAEVMRRGASSAPDRGAVRPDPATTAALVRACSDHRSYEAEVVFDAPTTRVAPCLSPVLGRLEPLGDATCRLVGTTDNPWWYAEELAAVPAAFRIVGGPELRDAVAVVGERLVAAARPHA
ncbi:MAG: HTH domain-containing protein [Actinomycetota bacterium]|nr:HTH domain-containing protein [Actinomycetota bacterium]